MADRNEVTTRKDSELMTPGQRWSRLWPFVGAFVVAVGLAWVPSHGPQDAGLMVAAAALIAVTAATILLGWWSLLPEIMTVVPVIALCVAVDMMRGASGGGSSAGYGSLLLIPVIWQALRRRQLELTLTIVAVSLANIAAVVLLSSPVAAEAQWRSVILFTIVAATIGQTVRRLVCDRNQLVEQVRALAVRDSLTGLPNRRGWDEHFPAAVGTAVRSSLPLTVALLDLDHFKAYNDTHGHQAGDDLLAGAAVAWESTLRAGDLLVRWGGEEFALLLPATDDAEALVVLDRLQRATPHGQTFSTGYTVERFRPGSEPDLDAIVAAADAALYAAKAGGRDRVERAPSAEPSDIEPRPDLDHRPPDGPETITLLADPSPAVP